MHAVIPLHILPTSKEKKTYNCLFYYNYVHYDQERKLANIYKLSIQNPYSCIQSLQINTATIVSMFIP